jgi:hypothetical protein
VTRDIGRLMNRATRKESRANDERIDIDQDVSRTMLRPCFVLRRTAPHRDVKATSQFLMHGRDGRDRDFDVRMLAMKAIQPRD